MPGKPVIYTAILFFILSCSRDTENTIYLDGEILMEEVVEEVIEEVSELPFEANLTLDLMNGLQFPNGLMESAEGTDFVSLYDNALSALAFLATDRIVEAEKILDYFNERIDTELLSGNGGFYQFRNGQGGEKRTIWLGDNAWLLIAINNYKEKTGSGKYDLLSIELEIWIRSLQGPDGGLSGGYREDGTAMHVITEGMLAAFNAVNGYDDFHKGIVSFLEEKRWNEQEKLLVAWPENENYYYAMDLHSLGFMVFEEYPLSTLNAADRYITTQYSTTTGEELWGYCFDEDKDVIWLEGTGQMALAYRHARMYSRADEILYELSKAGMQYIEDGSFHGLAYSSNQGSTYGAVPLWDHADSKTTLSSTIWYLFNILDFNPLVLGQSKNIPDTDKFWIP